MSAVLIKSAGDCHINRFEPCASLFAFTVTKATTNPANPLMSPKSETPLTLTNPVLPLFVWMSPLVFYFKNPLDLRYPSATSFAFWPSTAIFELRDCRVTRSRDAKTGSRIFSISGYLSKTDFLIMGAGS